MASDYQLGISRQHGAYADFYSQDQIFKEAAAAFRWIADKQPADVEN